MATAAATHHPAHHGDVETDVAVVGGGIAGLTAALLAKQDGRRVAVVGAGRVASGVTGYTTVKLTALHGLVYDDLARAYGDEAALLYADAYLAAIAKVAALVERHGIDCDLEQRPSGMEVRVEGRHGAPRWDPLVDVAARLEQLPLF